MLCNLAFKNTPKRYGLESQIAAAQQNVEKFSALDVNLKIETCGFLINPKYLFFSYSPARCVTWK